MCNFQNKVLFLHFFINSFVSHLTEGLMSLCPDESSVCPFNYDFECFSSLISKSEFIFFITGFWHFIFVSRENKLTNNYILEYFSPIFKKTFVTLKILIDFSEGNKLHNSLLQILKILILNADIGYKVILTVSKMLQLLTAWLTSIANNIFNQKKYFILTVNPVLYRPSVVCVANVYQ